ncbi:MAG: PQQ-binding-like beta-propeller repeat protein [Phycisphaerales bacterium]|nr:PQQ-binding-like beta-propeller repeat protein [Phycisphaerales bacterium]
MTKRMWTISALTLVAFSAGVVFAQENKDAPDKAKPATEAKLKKGDWTMWGGAPDRNMVSDETGIPDEWDIQTGKNIKWVAPLGSQTYGNPSISNGKIFLGTNNDGEFRKSIPGDKGVILCLDEATGKLLWQATHDKLPTGRVNDWPEQGICSAPAVSGDRLYYVSNEAQLVCADTEGFLDGENDGPFKDEKYADKQDADFVWKLDMIEELGVFPHNLATSSPVIWEDLVFVITSNGVDEGHLNIPSPDAPAFIAVNKDTGELVWYRNDPDSHILHGQWSSPTVGMVNGKALAVFAGGDGWCYAFEPRTGNPVWKFEMNPKGAEWKLGGRGTKNNIIATPVIFDNHVYLCVGQDPEHGEGPGRFVCIDATKTGDISESGLVWERTGRDFTRSMSTCAIKDGLLYVSNLSGFLFCLDAKTGELKWRHDTESAIWGSPYFVDGKVMLGDEDGEVLIMAAGAVEKEIRTIDMRSSVYTTPVAANGVLYITTRNKLFAIGGASGSSSSAAAASSK